MRKILPGDKSPYHSARNYNEFVDAANASKRERRAFYPNRSGDVRSPVNPTLIKVYNTSGGTIDEYRAVELLSSAIDPTTDEMDFMRYMTINIGDSPTTTEQGRWGITQDPIPASAIGYVAAYGVTPAWVNILNSSHTYVEHTGSGIMQSTDGRLGSAGTLIYVKGGVGAATATGNQWVLMNIGQVVRTAPGVLIACTLEDPAGERGDNDTMTDLDYTVYDTDGNLLGTHVHITGNGQRIVNAYCEVPGTKGWGYFDSDDNFVLLWADERFEQDNCSDVGEV